MASTVLLTVLLVVAVAGLAAVVLGARRATSTPAPDWEARLAAVRPEVVRQLWERRPVNAVRLVRAATGLSLKEAKEATDAIAFEERIDPRRGRPR